MVKLLFWIRVRVSITG